MAYDEHLAGRVRELMLDRYGFDEKKMFGGIAFMLNGNMACGVHEERLMVRVGPEAWETALAEPEAREMDFTGRSMKGFVVVDSEHLAEDDRLARWVEKGAEYADSLPPK